MRSGPPGPRARRAVAEDRRWVSPSYTRSYPFVMARGRGCDVEDVDGNRYLDFTAGVAVAATGHCHPRVVRAVREQAGRFLHMCGTDFYYELQGRLASRLGRLISPTGRGKVFFSNSGTEAVEAAMKLARWRTRRPRFLAFLGGFHGRTFGSLSLTSSKAVQRAGFGPLLPETTHVPYANCYRCPYKLEFPSCNLYCVNVIEEELFRKSLPPEEVAAIVVEPIQGEGGYVVPPPGFLERLSAIARRHGILLVVDEIQSGMGRTGKLLASQHTAARPDIVCLAKGIASGLPLGATVARDGLMSWPVGAHANTFGGNPVACAAALETLDLLKEGLMENARRMGGRLMAGLKALQARHRVIGDVRGKGLMVGIELVEDPETRTPLSGKSRQAFVEGCFRRGLLLLGCGANSIRFCPPLVVKAGQVDRALAVVDEALSAIEA